MARSTTSRRATPSTSSLLRRETSLALHDEHTLRLAVVADTHSVPHPKTAELLARERPHAILHAGDIGELAVLDTLRSIAPTLAVRGNIDVHASALPDDLTIDVTEADGQASLFKILLTHIAVYGAKLHVDAATRARDDGAALVICGHSHVPFIAHSNGIDTPTSCGSPSKVGTRALRNFSTTHCPRGVPSRSTAEPSGPWSSDDVSTPPSGAKVTMMCAVPDGPSASRHGFRSIAPSTVTAAS
jgi:putative phosphoesterase